MNNIQELIADGEITPFEAAQQLALVTAMLRQLKDSETALRGYLTDHLDPKEHLTTALGVVSYKRGSESRWRVKDPVAYGQWLAMNGETASVEEVLYPVEYVTKPDAIEKLVRDHGGEQPDGVELSGGRVRFGGHVEGQSVERGHGRPDRATAGWRTARHRRWQPDG
jgi:hypothetical protein